MSHFSKRIPSRRGRLGVAIALPLLGLWAVAERGSWRPRIVREHKGAVLGLAFSRDGKTLASASASRAALSDVGTLQATRSFPMRVYGNSPIAAFAPDLSVLACSEAGPDGYARLALYEVSSGRRKWAHGALDTLGALAFSPHGDTLAAVGTRPTGVPWEMQEWSTLWQLDGVPRAVRRAFSGEITMRAHIMAFSPSGDTLAAGLVDGSLRLWNTRGLKKQRLLNDVGDSVKYTTAVLSVAFSPDGRLIASDHADNAVRLWNASTGKLLRTLKSPFKAASATAFSPDSRLLACPAAGDVVLWDVSTGQQQRVLKVGREKVTCVAFTPSGRDLACGYESGAIALWRVR